MIQVTNKKELATRFGTIAPNLLLEKTLPKANKFGNNPLEIDGVLHQSTKEANRWSILKLEERAGVISDLKRQVDFLLIPKQTGERACYYKADFVYRNKDGQLVVEDTKGKTTKDYVIKRKLMLWVHNIKICET